MVFLIRMLLFLLISVVLLSACSPHSSTGVWKTTDDNEFGISKLVVAFDGKAEFVSKKLDNANWHCFWAATAKQEAELKCTPSTDTEKEESFKLRVNEQGLAELSHNSTLIAILKRTDENPVL